MQLRYVYTKVWQLHTLVLHQVASQKMLLSLGVKLDANFAQN